MNRTFATSAALAIALMLANGPASAQDASDSGSSNAVGGNWSAEVDAADDPNDGPAEVKLDAASLKSIKRVNAYFNDLIHLQGKFTQTDSNRNETNGRFYVHRPGRLRFEYAKPSLLRIVADGQYLSIEDHDLKTVDKYPLESTPFRMLLTEDVDLVRDARIMGFTREPDAIVLTLQDRSSDTPGQIKLFFNATKKGAKIELKEWIITDPQGLDTRIQVADLVKGKEVSSKLFDTSTVQFPDFNN
jgi:outer membrane lipoprotein-sorting protein